MADKLSLPTRVKAAVQILAGSIGLTDAKAWRAAYPAATSANKSVTPNSALQVATVWACIRLLSETISTLPIFLYRKGAQDSRTVATDHPLYGLLHDAPHADHTAVEFWEGVVIALCLLGNAYARKDKIGGRTVSLTPLRADLMAVDRDDRGARRYRYSGPEARGTYSEDDIFHIRGFGGAGDMGLSPISYARQSIGASLAADEMAGEMLANGLRPTGILSVDQVLKPDQRKQVHDAIVAPFVGSDKAGGVMVLEAKMQFQPLTMNMDDAQFLETRSFQIEEICRWFGVPPFMVAHTEKSTSWGTGLEQQNIGFLTYALRPYLTRIEQAIKRSLLSPVERLTLYAEFETDGLLRADSKTRTDNLVKLTAGGILTRNEARGILNWPAKPGADDLTVQAQNVPVGTNTNDPAPAGD